MVMLQDKRRAYSIWVEFPHLNTRGVVVDKSLVRLVLASTSEESARKKVQQLLKKITRKKIL